MKIALPIQKQRESVRESEYKKSERTSEDNKVEGNFIIEYIPHIEGNKGATKNVIIYRFCLLSSV